MVRTWTATSTRVIRIPCLTSPWYEREQTLCYSPTLRAVALSDFVRARPLLTSAARRIAMCREASNPKCLGTSLRKPPDELVSAKAVGCITAIRALTIATRVGLATVRPLTKWRPIMPAASRIRVPSHTSCSSSISKVGSCRISLIVSLVSISFTLRTSSRERCFSLHLAPVSKEDVHTA